MFHTFQKLIDIDIFRLHCINLLEEQQRIDASVKNLTIGSDEFKNQNNTLALLINLLHKSGCFKQICDQLETTITSAIDKWDYEMQDFTNATYEAIITRSNLK